MGRLSSCPLYFLPPPPLKVRAGRTGSWAVVAHTPSLTWKPPSGLWRTVSKEGSIPKGDPVDCLEVSKPEVN